MQWDYEICEDKNTDLLYLLEETRAVLPPGKTIGVATALWMPGLLRSLGYGWSEEYFSQIAARCDQIAVMGYDSSIYLPRMYTDFMAKQVVVATHAARLGNPKCRVLVGIPTYEKGGPSHNAHAENLTNALRGVSEGLKQLSPEDRSVFAGVAVFADYTTSPDEWYTYYQLW